ncbi:MAG: hypothetical protein ACFWTN_11880 [Clostridium sp.]
MVAVKYRFFPIGIFVGSITGTFVSNVALICFNTFCWTEEILSTFGFEFSGNTLEESVEALFTALGLALSDVGEVEEDSCTISEEVLLSGTVP